MAEFYKANVIYFFAVIKGIHLAPTQAKHEFPGVLYAEQSPGYDVV